jgi:hypothetical protein
MNRSRERYIQEFKAAYLKGGLDGAVAWATPICAQHIKEMQLHLDGLVSWPEYPRLTYVPGSLPRKGDYKKQKQGDE